MRLRLILLVLCITSIFQASSQAAKNGLPEPVIPDCFGVNIHFWGDNDKEIRQIADAGFKFIRMDTSWGSIEKEKGKYNWSDLDGLMTGLDRYGIRPILILDYGNKLYSGTDNERIAPYEGEYLKAFAAFAHAAAAHFKDRGILWEIWNEPNIGFWGPSPNPLHYAACAKAAAKAIHEADPHATVLAPALSGLEPNFTQEICKQGILEDIDVYSTHPYRSPNRAPETALPEYPAFGAIINKYAPKGKSIPLISGEWGYPMTDLSAEQQAQYLVRMFLVNIMSGVRLSIWYDWHDDGEDPRYSEHHFGTVYYDFKPKPAYFAAQTLLTKQLNGYRFVRRIQTEKDSDLVAVFTNGSNYRLAAWTTGDPHEISLKTVDVPAVVISDMYGNRKKAAVAGGTLKLNVSQSVIYVGSPYNGEALNLK